MLVTNSQKSYTRKGDLMHENLLKEMRKKRISHIKLSKLTSINYDNLIAKIRGEIEFTKTELNKIAKVLKPKASEKEFEDLFYIEDE